MHTMFYANEVRKEQEFKADEAQVADKELGLAVKLIEALAAKFEPEEFRGYRVYRVSREVPERLVAIGVWIDSQSDYKASRKRVAVS